MRRTLAEIENQIAEKWAASALLAQFDTDSDLSFARILRGLLANILWLHEQIWEDRAEALEARFEGTRTGTPLWYAEQARAFQLGDALILVDGKPGYAVVDESKQLIARAVVNETPVPGELLMKVAKLSAGQTVALTALELEAFAAYMNQVKFAGIHLTLRSVRNDYLTVTATVYRDALVPLSVLRPAVEKAITDYLLGIDYGGFYRESALVDAVQKVPGVKDFIVASSSIRHPNAATQTNPRFYQLYSGAAEVNPETPLLNTLSYIVQ
jgi:hypothetical protein